MSEDTNTDTDTKTEDSERDLQRDLQKKMSSINKDDIMFYHVPENLVSTGDASFDLLKDYISKASKKMEEQQVKVNEDSLLQQKLERQKIWEEENAKKKERLKQKRLERRRK